MRRKRHVVIFGLFNRSPELKSKEQVNSGRRKTSKGEKLFLETAFRSSFL